MYFINNNNYKIIFELYREKMVLQIQANLFLTLRSLC